MNHEYNILDVILLKNKKYIVLLSGLPFSPIEKIAAELEKDFNAITLNYLHLELNDDLSVINNRVTDLLKKTKSQLIIILAKSFPSNNIKLPIDIHFNISISKNLVIELDPNKTPNLYEQYQEIIKTNKVNRYINIKKDYNLDEIILHIFNFIIDDITKKVYPENPNEPYKIVPKPDPYKLIANPKAISYDEKKEIALKQAVEEINDEIQNDKDESEFEKDDDLVDMLSDDSSVLSNELRTLGARY